MCRVRPAQSLIFREAGRSQGIQAGSSSLTPGPSPPAMIAVARFVLANRQVQRIQRHTDLGLQAIQEASVLEQLGGGRCFPKLYGVFTLLDPVQLVLAIEYVGMSLALLTQTAAHGDALPMSTLQAVCRQLLVCLAELHAKQIVHADIKPANLTWHAGSAHVKLIDFGHAFSLGETSGPIQSIGYRAPEATLSLVCSEARCGCVSPARTTERMQLASACACRCGTVSPTAAVDIWSAGCVFRELHAALFGRLRPHASGTDRWFFQCFDELIDSCLQHDAHMRCSAAEGLGHRFFACPSGPAPNSLMRATLILPTAALILIGILAHDLDWLATDASVRAGLRETVEDVQSECAHFGHIECFFCAKLLEGSIVYIRYSRAEQAEVAWRNLNARTFDGRAVTAVFAAVDLEAQEPEFRRLDVR